MNGVLGDKVKDKVTGLTGILYGIAHYLHGEDQVCIQSPVNADNKLEQAWWMPASRIELVKE